MHEHPKKGYGFKKFHPLCGAIALVPGPTELWVACLKCKVAMSLEACDERIEKDAHLVEEKRK